MSKAFSPSEAGTGILRMRSHFFEALTGGHRTTESELTEALYVEGRILPVEVRKGRDSSSSVAVGGCGGENLTKFSRWRFFFLCLVSPLRQ